MTEAISNGIVIMLLFLQNANAQQGVNNVVSNAVSQPKTTCNTAGVNFNSAQPGQQINWQQPSNMQLAPSQQPHNSQQAGISSQLKQQYPNPLTEIFSALQSLRFSQKPQGVNPTVSSATPATQPQNQPIPVSNNPQTQFYANQVPEYPKPTFTFQFVPVSPQNTAENQIQNSMPVQFLANGQSQVSQAGPSYYTQNQPTSVMANQQVPISSQTSSGQSQPIVLTLNSQQPTGQSQPLVYTLQPSQQTRSSNQLNTQPNPASDNSMALLMSQLQSSSGNADIASILPMLINSKQDKSGMKTLLPLLLNLLTDRGCGCPNCGCPYNNVEPTINGGYSNQVNYSQQADVAHIPESKTEVKNIKMKVESKKYKTDEISDISEEVSDEDDEYEYEDD